MTVRIPGPRVVIVLVGLSLSVAGCSSETVERTVLVTTTLVQTSTTTVTATATQDARNPLRGDLSGQDVFDSDRMNRDVLAVLTNPAPAGYGLAGVSDIECPERQPVKVDSSFTCSLEIDGRSTTLTVKVLSADGQYQVNPPN